MKQHGVSMHSTLTWKDLLCQRLRYQVSEDAEHYSGAAMLEMSEQRFSCFQALWGLYPAHTHNIWPHCLSLRGQSGHIKSCYVIRVKMNLIPKICVLAEPNFQKFTHLYCGCEGGIGDWYPHTSSWWIPQWWTLQWSNACHKPGRYRSKQPTTWLVGRKICVMCGNTYQQAPQLWGK